VQPNEGYAKPCIYVVIQMSIRSIRRRAATDFFPVLLVAEGQKQIPSPISIGLAPEGGRKKFVGHGGGAVFMAWRGSRCSFVS